MLQDLCPSLHPVTPFGRWWNAARPMGWAASVMLALASPAALANTGADALLEQAQAWVAQQHSAPAKHIEMRPMDSRLQVPDCPDGWVFEAPFPGQPSVRAACESAKTQLFVQWRSERVRLSLPSVPRVASVDADAPKKALAASRTLPRGSHLDASMVQWVQVPAAQWSAHHLSNRAVIEGSELMRDLVPGQIIRRQDIRPSVLVKKGQMVSLQVGQPDGFTITATVQALQNGRMGEQVRLKNPDSGRILSGVVSGLNAVRSP
jgi:flagellar basal body P-ring formation protein FlgA